MSKFPFKYFFFKVGERQRQTDRQGQTGKDRQTDRQTENARRTEQEHSLSKAKDKHGPSEITKWTG